MKGELIDGGVAAVGQKCALEGACKRSPPFWDEARNYHDGRINHDGAVERSSCVFDLLIHVAWTSRATRESDRVEIEQRRDVAPS